MFLYTVGSGPCSKSHGFNAAKLAGLPKSIIEVGRSVAEEFEIEQKNLLQFSFKSLLGRNFCLGKVTRLAASRNFS